MLKSNLFKVFAIPLFQDNYSYAFHSFQSENMKTKISCFLVDPADTNKILQFLNTFSNLEVSHILYTHKHSDHIGNPSELLKAL